MPEFGQAQLYVTTTEANGAGNAESHGDPPAAPEPLTTTREHWCSQHETAFTQRNGKTEDSWWSHKAEDSSWYRERS